MNAGPVNTDPLDIAYLAIGAARMLDQLPRARALLDKGELEMVQMAVDAAPVLQKLWEEQDGEWDGVWAYDVAEPLGAAVVFNYVGNDFDESPQAYERLARSVLSRALPTVTP